MSMDADFEIMKEDRVEDALDRVIGAADEEKKQRKAQMVHI